MIASIFLSFLINKYVYASFLVPPPTVPPFTSQQVIQVTTSTTITLTIPFISTAFLNSDPIEYIVQFQGFLLFSDLFPSSRRRRQAGDDIIAMTEEMTMSVPYKDDRNIDLMGLQPNFKYNVFPAIRTAIGTTPSVQVMPPTLAAIGNIIYACSHCSVFLKNHIYNNFIYLAPTGPPINVTAVPVTTPDGMSQMSLNVSFANDFFTVNGPFNSFNIFYKTDGEAEQEIEYNPISGDRGPFAIIISGLSPNSLYAISVDVVTPAGTSGRSSNIFATTSKLSNIFP